MAEYIERTEGGRGMLICTCPNELECPVIGSSVVCLPWCEYLKERTVKAMIDECKWMQDEVCVNADCPLCCDFCPVADTAGVCRYEERGDRDASES